MHLQTVAIVTDVWGYKHLNEDNVPSANHKVTSRTTLLVTYLLLLVQLQTVSAAPTTTGVNVNDLTTTTPTTVKASDDTSSSGEHFFYDIPPAASTILITLFAAVFSYGLSVGINVLCPDQCNHRGTCANNNTTAFFRRYKRTVNPLSKCSENETKSHHSQYPLPVIGIPNGRPNYKDNVQQWLEQVDHTIGVPEDVPVHGDEVDPDNIATVTYENEIEQAAIDTRTYMDNVDANGLPTTLDINGECANKNFDNLFVVIPDVTNTSTVIEKTNIAKETNGVGKHIHIVQVEINGCVPKDQCIESTKGGISQPKREIKQNAWNGRESRKVSADSSPDSCGLKENEPLLISPSRTASTPSTPTSAQKCPPSITLESITTEDTSIKEGSPDNDRMQIFVPIKEDAVLKSPVVDACPEARASTHNMECGKTLEETKDI